MMDGDGGEGRGQSRKGGKSESTADQHVPVDTGPWPEKLTDHQRDTVVCRLASKGAAKRDPTKIAPKDMEGNPVPNYLQNVKSANGVRRFDLFYF